jgi:hypothetical protein
LTRCVDTGAGVFGALNHIDFVGTSKKKKSQENAFTDPDWGEEEGGESII